MTPISPSELSELMSGLFGKLKERSVPISIADLSTEGEPLIFINDAFEKLTGYDRSDVIGTNCRFLQGHQTDPRAVQQIRDAIDNRESTEVCLLNYRANGVPFHNLVMLDTLRDQGGHELMLGCQFDLSRHVRHGSIHGHIREVQGLVSEIRVAGRFQSTSPVITFQTWATSVLATIDSYFAVQRSTSRPR